MRTENLMGGEWIRADDGRELEVTDPATDRVVATVPDCGSAETRRAISAAAEAAPAWAGTSTPDRVRILEDIATSLESKAESLASIIVAENGKPRREALAEVDYAASFFRAAASAATESQEEFLDLPGRQVTVEHRPIGVTAAITPWNFPLAMLAKKTASALAAGCPQIVKPAEQTPLAALAFAEIAREAGVPAGVLAVLTGRPEPIGDALLGDPRVRKLSFTGSTEVGRMLMRNAASNLLRLSMELGGHAPFLVFEDADVEEAVRLAMAAKFRNGGQTCICPNRFLVDHRRHDRFVERLATEAARLRSGFGHDPSTDLGPLIDDRGMAKVEAHVADAVECGATLATGGGRRTVVGGTDRFPEPTVLVGVTSEMRCWREETFGPVCPVRAFHDEDEAFALANDSDYGLAGYAVTRDPDRAARISRTLQTGIIGINDPAPANAWVPFGGRKQSGFGREGGRWGLAEYLETVTTSRIAPDADAGG